MKLKHKINIADRNGYKQKVSQSEHRSIPKRLLTFLFGEFCEFLALTPGESMRASRSSKCGATAMNENIELMMPVKAAPYGHQKKVLSFAYDKFGVFDECLKGCGTALSMKMGTSKTIVSLAVAGCMYQYRKVNRVLAVTPLSTLGVWEEQFEKFADFPCSMAILKGTAEKKRLTKLSDGGMKVVVVNYKSAWRLEKTAGVQCQPGDCGRGAQAEGEPHLPEHGDAPHRR